MSKSSRITACFQHAHIGNNYIKKCYVNINIYGRFKQKKSYELSLLCIYDVYDAHFYGDVTRITILYAGEGSKKKKFKITLEFQTSLSCLRQRSNM